MKSLELIKNFFNESIDPIFIINKDDEKVIFQNKSAHELFKNITKISDIEHYFNFEVCILNSESYFTYTPIKECLASSISVSIEIILQLGNSHFQEYILKSVNEEKYTVLGLFSKSDVNSLNVKIKKLENNLKENESYRLSAHNLALRNALINSISNEIKDCLDTNQIINKAFENIANLVNAGYGAYIKAIGHDYKIMNVIEKELTYLDYSDNDIANMNSSSIYSKNGINTLISPLKKREKIFGYLQFGKTDEFNKEEIIFIDSITSQISSAVFQVDLMSELENKNSKLLETLNELQKTQSKLIQSEKMASLGHLVAGVAHEINTPIGAIKNNNSILLKAIKKLDNGNENFIINLMQDTLDVNNDAISRISEIIKSLKNFARLDESEYKQVNIHEGINSTLLIIKHELTDKIEIEMDLGNVPEIYCYPNLLNQVFMNLIVNAIQSIEKYGKIKIKTDFINNKLIIKITDTGKGIEPENLNKIFDPGFTTKGAGIGTGLGLSICYQIIEKHNGSINVYSKVGEGTTFVVELPVG